ncbi:MAG: hypothetical protein ACK5KP_08630 [Paludibacteraceae bacterium]
MEEHTDFVEYDRPGEKKVRIVFELYRYEILFHYCEFRQGEKDEWKSMTKDENGYFEYTIVEDSGKEISQRIKFPTQHEIMSAQEEIAKKYNIISF